MKSFNRMHNAQCIIHNWICIIGSWLNYALCIVNCTLLLGGCTLTRYVPVESVRTEWREREAERVLTDTVTDTRLVWIKGDTVVDIRERRERQRVEIHDTLYTERHDTVCTPYPVERPLSRWERTKQEAGGVAIGIATAALAFIIIWLIKKIRNLLV